MKKAIAISFGVIAEEKLPISLAWLSGVFEKCKLDYNVIDFNYELYNLIDKNEYDSIRHNTLKNPSINIQMVIDKCVNDIFNYAPDILCVSVFSYRQYYITKLFLEHLKTKNPNFKITIGGPGVWYISPNTKKTNGYELCVNNLVDSYTLGNGEEVILEHLTGVDESNLYGVNTLKKLNINPEEEWTNLIKKIQDKYIPPSYKKIPIVDRSNNNKEIFISGANGCPGRCAFCSIREYIPFPSYRDGIEIADECYKLYKETGVTRFKRTDALANGHPSHFKSFNSRIVYHMQNDNNFKFEYNAMFVPKDERIHNEEYYELMSKAGCKSLDIGIESGSERLRKEMHKGYTDKQLDWHFEMCQKYGIKNNISLFVGFPTETDEDFNENLKMLDRYQKYILDNTFNEIQHCGKFVLYTKTYIYNNLDEYSIKILDESKDPIEWTCTKNATNTSEKRIEREFILMNYAKNLGYKIDVYDSNDK
jgi:radical SAM superfamily enzyme YgiQ (UPF0313 family)